MARTQEEMWASCESVGKAQAQNWIDSQSVRGVELGFVKQWLEHKTEKESQQKYNLDVLEEARKANRTAWIAAVASMISAFTACLAVIIGKS
ncbi:MAG: hypothetical protein GW903_04815 [Alphaproteobacteria bacterium]|nr:hypothetical protein [Alphaproteobacteria bacterium]NCQ88292.1 hypothetical protein [Alphaproteobacteria bacterium]NCT05201.1 hypothetical protein [Alphaproteobacteria bacterium]